MDSKLAIKQFLKLKKYADKTNMRLAAEGWNKPWKILIATILSAQTRDEQTIKFATILFNKFNSPKKLGNAKLTEIEEIIRPLNYYKTKAKNVKKCCLEISKRGLNNSFEELIKLPGVGRKTANVYLAEAWSADTIGVDTHLSYISRKLDWTNQRGPDKIEKDLENLFPKRYWGRLNRICVRFGKTYTSKNKKNKILDEIKNGI